MPQVVALNRFPIKGMGPEKPCFLQIDPDVGVVGDRNVAYPRQPDQPLEWAQKSSFFAGANEPAMVAIHPSNPDFSRLPQDKPLPTTALDTQGAFNFTDTRGPTVTLLNAYTARAFSAFVTGMSYAISNDRYRMNVVVSGLEKLTELDWVTSFPGQQLIRIGDVWFRVHDACERCVAINVNPATGMKDLDLTKGLREFMTQQRPLYRSPQRKTPLVMGVILVPLDRGIIEIGDKVGLG